MNEVSSLAPQSIMQPAIDPQINQSGNKGVLCGRISIPMESFFGNGGLGNQGLGNQGLIGMVSSIVQQVLGVVSSLIGRLFGGQAGIGYQNICKTGSPFSQQQNGVQGMQFGSQNQQVSTNDIFGSLVDGFFNFGSSLMNTGKTLLGGVGSLFKGLF